MSSHADEYVCRDPAYDLQKLQVTPFAGLPDLPEYRRNRARHAPDAIPRRLLDGLADPPAVLAAVGRLAAYSMLTADAGTLAVHRLMQAVTRTPAGVTPTVTPRR